MKSSVMFPVRSLIVISALHGVGFFAQGAEPSPIVSMQVDLKDARFVLAQWMEFSPDGKYFALKYTPFGKDSGSIGVWEWRKEKLISSVPVSASNSFGVTTDARGFDPNRKWVIYCSENECRFIETGNHLAIAPISQKLVKLPDVKSTYRGLYLSASGKLVADLCIDREESTVTARLHQIGAERKSSLLLKETLNGYTPSVATINNDFSSLAVSSTNSDGKIRVEIAQIGDKKNSPLRFEDLPSLPLSLGFSPDCLLLAVGMAAGEITWINIEDKSMRKPILLGQRGVASLSFHPGGKFLAVATADLTGRPNVFLLNVETGDVLTRLDADPKGTSAVRFDSTGDYLAVITKSGIIKIYDARPLLKLQKE